MAGWIGCANTRSGGPGLREAGVSFERGGLVGVADASFADGVGEHVDGLVIRLAIDGEGMAVCSTVRVAVVRPSAVLPHGWKLIDGIAVRGGGVTASLRHRRERARSCRAV